MALLNKPKIFIVQACRGTRHTQAITTDTPMENGHFEKSPNSLKDVVIFFSKGSANTILNRIHGSKFKSPKVRVISLHLK